MEDEFYDRARADLARLLSYWREIERWIKKAEQVNNAALIPAINELRYASRQLFNAQLLFTNADLNEGQKSVVRCRLIIAEQYLINAEHDIVDGIIAFYRSITRKLDTEFGQTAITENFLKYPFLKQELKICDQLIEDARHNYDNRRENYRNIREAKFPLIIDLYDDLVSAEVSVRETANRLKRNLEIAKGRKDLLWWAAITGWPIAVITFMFSWYTWTTTYDDFCASHKRVVGIICKIKPPAAAK